MYIMDSNQYAIELVIYKYTDRRVKKYNTITIFSEGLFTFEYFDSNAELQEKV